MVFRVWQWFSIGVIYGAALVLVGCANGPTSPPSQAVVITAQPLSQTVPLGQTATFSVTATGTAPLSYQWSENGVPISGAKSASYTTPDVALGPDGSTQIGTFQVTVSNEANSVASKSATLTAGPRSPKAGDLRYLLFQQVDLPNFGNQGGVSSGIYAGTDGYLFSSYTNALGTPLTMGSAYLCGEGTCDWYYSTLNLTPPMTGLSMYYRAGKYANFASDLQSDAAVNVVFTSLDLEPAENGYAVSWVQTTQPGGFDYRLDPMIAPGTDQAAQIQAQASQDGSESRVITAVSFDASGNAILISYGWTGDTTTVYDTQTKVVPAGGQVGANVLSAATSLANNGYIISAFGGNDTNGYILVGMRVHGDSLPRPINTPSADSPPYATTVVYLYEQGNAGAIINEN